MSQYVTLEFKRGTASKWTTVNPTLAPGEPGFELDTDTLKIGDGITPWNDLEVLRFGTSVAVGYQAGQANQSADSISIGSEAGKTDQNQKSIAIGYGAGESMQKEKCIAIGNQAGLVDQGDGVLIKGCSIAIGSEAAFEYQKQNCIAIGNQAGKNTQRQDCIAIGYEAGKLFQGSGIFRLGSSIAIGTKAGYTDQTDFSVAIGSEAGYTNQGQHSVAIGTLAGKNNQRNNSIVLNASGNIVDTTQEQSFYVRPIRQDVTKTVPLMYDPSTYEIVQGSTNQQFGITGGTGINVTLNGTTYTVSSLGSVSVTVPADSILFSPDGTGISGTTGFQYSATGITLSRINIQGGDRVAIGSQAGVTGQEANSVAIGSKAGQTGQAGNSVALGYLSGNNGQKAGSVAIGFQAGENGQEGDSIAIGSQSGQHGQNYYSIAIGRYAANTGQGIFSLAIGTNAGQSRQGYKSIAIGPYAGQTDQVDSALAIGNEAGQIDQKTNCIAIGTQAGKIGQTGASIAIAYVAGQTRQQASAIAIGNNAGQTDQHNNSIVLNASGVALNTVQASSFFVKPIRTDLTQTTPLCYNSTTGEIVMGNKSTTGSWTVSTGTSTYSITVPQNGTYSIWVRGNIPNGIIVYTATVVVTNNNVPAIGSAYAWYYKLAGDLETLQLTSIPPQIVGTVNTISIASLVTTTSNVFEFGINNLSGASQVVNWGYLTL